MSLPSLARKTSCGRPLMLPSGLALSPDLASPLSILLLRDHCCASFSRVSATCQTRPGPVRQATIQRELHAFRASQPISRTSSLQPSVPIPPSLPSTAQETARIPTANAHAIKLAYVEARDLSQRSTPSHLHHRLLSVASHWAPYRRNKHISKMISRIFVEQRRFASQPHEGHRSPRSALLQRQLSPSHPVEQGRSLLQMRMTQLW